MSERGASRIPHVLLVEDSALVVAALRVLLEQTGHRVSTAGTVCSAVEIARADPPDVMLLDLSLPDGEGLGVLTALHAAGDRSPITVAYTGHDSAEVRKRCLAAGCVDVLTKPIAAMELPGRIAKWLADRDDQAPKTATS